MSSHELEFQEYESEHMKVRESGLRGRCYLVFKEDGSLTGPEEVTMAELLSQQEQLLRFGEVELYLNLA